MPNEAAALDLANAGALAAAQSDCFWGRKKGTLERFLDEARCS